MKNLYSFSKLILISSLIIIGTSAFAVSPAPPPKASESVGGYSLVIRNNTKYPIHISDVIMANSGGWEKDQENLTVSAGKEVTYPSKRVHDSNCNYKNMSLSFNDSPVCFWGNLQFRNHSFNISSRDFEDPNKPYTIDISKTKSGFFEVESLAAKRKEGKCWYSTIKWEAVWINDHYEIILTEKPTETGLGGDHSYKCPDKKP